LRQLHEPYPDAERKRGAVHVGRAAVRVDGRTVVIERDGDDALDLLRAACLAIWESGTAIHALEVPERLYR
ncbi:MAG TPA: haloacid dehalogenase, partial [Agromyces sp.]|nr:haloacid dehalogenase [Agromyces sp.]